MKKGESKMRLIRRPAEGAAPGSTKIEIGPASSLLLLPFLGSLYVHQEQCSFALIPLQHLHRAPLIEHRFRDPTHARCKVQQELLPRDGKIPVVNDGDAKITI